MGILEALGEAAHSSKNPVLLTEYVRQAMRRAIVKPLVNAQGELPAYLLDPSLERAMESSVEHGELNSVADDGAGKDPRHPGTDGAANGERTESAVVMTSSGSRYFLRQIVEPSCRA